MRSDSAVTGLHRPPSSRSRGRRLVPIAKLGCLLTIILGGCLAGPRHVARVPKRNADPVVATNATNDAASPSYGAVPEPPSSLPIEVASAEPSAASSDEPQLGTGAGPDPSTTTATSNLVFATGPTPALTYGALDGATCEAWLKKRKISYVNVVGGAYGVEHPVRLTGKLHGVDFHGLEAAKDRPTSIWEIVDCREVLALDDFAAILEKHDVVEGVHMSMYRPAGKKEKPKGQHAMALAIDLGFLVKADGSKLNVQNDWHGAIGSKTCVPGTGPWPVTKQATELRAILCEAAAAKLFNVVLTPNFNKPHYNHFHLEVTRGVKWFIVH